MIKPAKRQLRAARGQVKSEDPSGEIRLLIEEGVEHWRDVGRG